MRELISHPGLQFYDFRLSGSLTYSPTIQVRPTRLFELCKSGFEGLSEQSENESVQQIISKDVSAVGL